MRRVGFGTTELAPHVIGGAGILTAELSERLADRGVDSHAVVGVDHRTADDLPSVTFVEPITAPGWGMAFMDMSMAVAEGLSSQHKTVPFDLIEVQDFDGLPFWLLTHRRDLGFGDVPIVVRFHGPVDLQIEAMGVKDRVLEAAAAMERQSYLMADGVVVPTVGIGELVVERYGVDPDRIAVGAPPVRPLSPTVAWSPGGTDRLCVGRRAEVKGSHDVVEAAVPVREDHPGARLVFVGADGW
ncbi:MAG: glycosyltransferase family 4 protein, partial [Acidimicrobiia bacterium]